MLLDLSSRRGVNNGCSRAYDKTPKNDWVVVNQPTYWFQELGDKIIDIIMPAVHTDAIFVEIFTVAFRAYLLAGMVGHTKYTPQNPESRHKKPHQPNQSQWGAH